MLCTKKISALKRRSTTKGKNPQFAKLSACAEIHSFNKTLKTPLIALGEEGEQFKVHEADFSK